MAKLMYPGANRSIRYRDPDAKGDLEQYSNRTEKGDQPQRVNRAGKGDRPQYVNREGKGDQPQRVNRAEKVNPVRGANVPKPKPKPKPNVIRTTVAERTTPVPKPKSKPAPAFKANFKGAAPTAMQARGGARINRGGGLLGLIKRKFGK